MAEGKFGTAINCMDGRVQEPVINWMKVRYGLDYVDMITEPGPIKLIAEQDPDALESILDRLEISIGKHNSNRGRRGRSSRLRRKSCLAEEQEEQIAFSVNYLRSLDLGVKVVGLYITDTWLVNVVQE